MRYPNSMYKWCLERSQATKHFEMPHGGTRSWSKEEMMCYIDWDKAEEERVERAVGIEMAAERLSGGSRRRGTGAIWDGVVRDRDEQ